MINQVGDKIPENRMESVQILLIDLFMQAGVPSNESLYFTGPLLTLFIDGLFGEYLLQRTHEKKLCIFKG